MATVDLRRTARSVTRKWMQQIVFPAVIREVRINLSGRMMNQRSGATLSDVMQNSRLTRAGFALATTKPGLQAWMAGSKRRAFFVAPVQAKALSWKVGARRFFSKGHMIGPWTFSPKRPVFQDAIDRTLDSRFIVAAWPKEFKRTFRGGKVSIRLN